ncbi:hypothetical protein LBMAG42_43690 [Deltaproteobacteria bacterium]|nr:hypothetical protein LBMAG42_43690 [Deltaproteobacteria bacterium]
MISSIVASLLLGCGSEPTEAKPVVSPEAPVTPPTAPTTPAPMGLERPVGSVVWRALDHLADATLAFPAGAPIVGIDGHFTLDTKWKDEGVRKGGWHAFSTPLPFATNMPRPNYAPMGARLYRESTEVPFNTTLSAPTESPVVTWYVDHGRIVLIAAENPSTWPKPPDLIVEELAAALKQRQFASSGLAAPQFALTQHSFERVSRPGLYLPAPASAEFSAALPAKGKLRFGLGVLEDPVSGRPGGDGMDLTVSVDGAQVWSGHIAGESAHQAVEVELPAGQARNGTVKFSSTAGDTAEGDYLVVTEPYIVDLAPARAPRRVVVVGIDTLRWDSLSANGYGRSTSPELDQWLAQSVQFTNAWSPAPRTKPSFRTAFTGRYPSFAGAAPTIAEVLGPLGFSTAGMVGNVHLVPRFGFNRGMDHWEYENGAKANDQVDRALAWASDHQGEDSFLFVHFMDPHTFYEAPEPWKGMFQEGKSKPKAVPQRFNRWQIYNLMKKQRLTDAGKAWIRAAYDAEVAFTAHELSRLLTGIETLPGDTLTVIHSDHGEEMWDHGQFEHNHTLYSELVHVELAVRPPKGWQGAPKITDNVGLVDIASTVFDFVGVPAERRPVSDGLSLRPLIDPAHAAAAPDLHTTLFNRPMPLGHMRYGRDRWGVIYQKYKYILHSSSGIQELYDLATDPGEKKNLAPDADAASLGLMREALGRATGWPVRRGFRIRVPSTATTTTLSFTSPIAAAGVLDPELNAELRANLEWGEHPKTLPAEVGLVTLSADRKTATFVPGPKVLGGALYIQCEADPCPTGTLRMGEKSAPIEGGKYTGGTNFSLEPGWVLIPADNSDDAEQSAAASGTETDQLESLGYLHSEKDEAEEP